VPQYFDRCIRNLIPSYNYKKEQSTENPRQDFSSEIDLFNLTQLQDNGIKMIAAFQSIGN
jgi:hypothetical protein